MRRREFFGLALAAPVLAAVPTRKVGKVEIAFKSPGPTPNGLQATDAGLWILDAGDYRVYLVRYEDGKVLRSFDTESRVASGITYGADALWLANTPSRTILRIDPATGKTLEVYATPGAGVSYRMAGDPPARRSPLRAAAPPAAAGQGGGRGRGQGQAAPPGSSPGTGANGLEWQDGKIWIAVPPARQIFCVDAKTWVVQQRARR